MKTKLKIMMLLFGIVIFALATKVHAYSVDVELTSEGKLVAGGDVAVSVNVKNIDATQTGISVLKGRIKYDTNIFEGYSVQIKNGWTSENKEDTFLFEKSSGVTTAEEVATIVFKVRSDLNADSGDINFSNITASGIVEENGGPGDIKVQAVSVKVSKAEPPVITKQKTKTVSKSKVNSDLPYTGTSDVLLVIAFAACIFGMVTFIKYKTIDK